MSSEREQAVSLRAAVAPRRSRTRTGPHDARSDELHDRRKSPLPRSPSAERPIEAIDSDDRLAYRRQLFESPTGDDVLFAKEAEIEPTDDSSSTYSANTITACTRCRQRETRCDLRIPRCGPCERADSVCEYYDPTKGHNVNRSYAYIQRMVHGWEQELYKVDIEDAAIPSYGGPDDAFAETATYRDVQIEPFAVDAFVVPEADIGDDAFAERGNDWENERENFVLLLRRLRRDIESVLDARVQWRQECQKLESCRKNCHDATDALMSAVLGKGITANPPEDPKPKTKRKKRKSTTSTIDQISLTHTDSASGPNTGSSLSSTTGFGNNNLLQIDAQDIKDGRLPTSASSAHPSANRDSALGSSDYGSTNRDTALLYEQYTTSYRALQQHELVVQDLTSKLNSLDFRVNEILEQLRAAMRMPGFAKQLQGHLLDTALTMSGPSSVASSESDMPPLIADFFDKSGDVGVFKERIRELDIAHLEGLEVRDALRDQDNEFELEVSDEQFEENYRLLRGDIELELEQAEREVEKLAMQCQQAGLEPNAFRRRQVDAFVSTRPSRAADSEMSSPVAQARPVKVQMTQPGSIGLTASARIAGWMNQVTKARPESIPEGASSAGSGSIASWTNQERLRPDIVPEAASEYRSEDLPKPAKDAAPKDLPEPQPEAAPERVQETTWNIGQKLSQKLWGYW